MALAVMLSGMAAFPLSAPAAQADHCAVMSNTAPAGTVGAAVERLVFAVPPSQERGDRRILYWVAPMDPNFRRDEPGLSPMGMELVPVYEGDAPVGDPSEVALSPVEINAIGVRTAIARVETLAPHIETVGFVGYDEHRTRHIHMRTEGWIEKRRPPSSRSRWSRC